MFFSISFNICIIIWILSMPTSRINRIICLFLPKIAVIIDEINLIRSLFALIISICAIQFDYHFPFQQLLLIKLLWKMIEILFHSAQKQSSSNTKHPALIRRKTIAHYEHILTFFLDHFSLAVLVFLVLQTLVCPRVRSLKGQDGAHSDSSSLCSDSSSFTPSWVETLIWDGSLYFDSVEVSLLLGGKQNFNLET